MDTLRTVSLTCWHYADTARIVALTCCYCVEPLSIVRGRGAEWKVWGYLTLSFYSSGGLALTYVLLCGVEIPRKVKHR